MCGDQVRAGLLAHFNGRLGGGQKLLSGSVSVYGQGPPSALGRMVLRDGTQWQERAGLPVGQRAKPRGPGE